MRTVVSTLGTTPYGTSNYLVDRRQLKNILKYQMMESILIHP